jgi:hypothetical protein
MTAMHNGLDRPFVQEVGQTLYHSGRPDMPKYTMKSLKTGKVFYDGSSG